MNNLCHSIIVISLLIIFIGVIYMLAVNIITVWSALGIFVVLLLVIVGILLMTKGR